MLIWPTSAEVTPAGKPQASYFNIQYLLFQNSKLVES